MNSDFISKVYVIDCFVSFLLDSCFGGPTLKGSKKKKANHFGMVNLIIDNIELKFFSNLVVISSSLKWWSPRFIMVFLYKSLNKFTNLVLHQIWQQSKNLTHVLKFTTQNDHNCMQLLEPTSSKHSNTITLLSQSYQSTLGSQLKHHHQVRIKMYSLHWHVLRKIQRKH